MTWRKFQEQAYDLTRAEVEALYPSIIRSYRDAKKAIDKQIKDVYLKLSDVAPDDYYNEMIKFDRLSKLQMQIAKEYNQFSRAAGNTIGESLEVGFVNSYYRAAFAASWIVPDYIPSVMPDAFIEFATFSTESSWKKISAAIVNKFGSMDNYGSQIGTLKDLLKKNRQYELTQIRETIVQGLRRGESYTTMSKSISDVIGKSVVKDGVQTFTGAMANAMRIVTTEGNRIMNDAHLANTKALEAQGSDVKKMWSATLDTRTRSTHARLDGKIKSVDAYFYIGQDKALKPGGFSHVKNNVRCRCTIVDIISDQPPTLRRGRDPVTGENEVFDYKTYPEWAEEKGFKIKKVKEVVA